MDKESFMKKEIGLWIDHREATIVTLTDGGEEIKHIVSNSGKHIRYSGSSHSKTPEGLKEVTAEDQRDRKFGNDLNKFYAEVIASLRDADSIQIFGPGEAKGELEKRIEQAGLNGHILAIESMDKMTDHQIAAKVREHFSTKNISEKTRPSHPNEKDQARNSKKDSAKKEMRGYHEQ
jgi:stalled ribosome rescue protein Dom34